MEEDLVTGGRHTIPAELRCFIISVIIVQPRVLEPKCYHSPRFFSIALRLDVSDLSTCEHCRLYSAVCFKIYHTLFS